MQKIYIPETIYKLSRKSAGFTKEAASEKIGCSLSTLSLWENGIGVTTRNVVRMARAYGDDGLVWRHLKSNDPCREYLPDFSEKCLICEMRTGGEPKKSA